MKVALIAPDWGNSWIPLIKAEVESRGHWFVTIQPGFKADNGMDVYIHAWAASNPIKGARNVMFLRRYELFSGCLTNIDWAYVSDLIMVNTWIKARVDEYFAEKGIKTRTHLIYNAVDTNKWTFKERHPNHRIGMSCHVHPKKNLPLALEVLANLPEGYELHIAGEVQDGCTAEYLNHMGEKLRRKVYLYGEIPREQLDLWWDQMGFCLSTSISEGNPNNVLEAMAKGIKPAVLNWPGAEDQFHPWVYNCAKDLAWAIKIVMDPQMIPGSSVGFREPYESARYRQHVEQHHSLNNITRAVDIALNTQE